MKYFIDTEFIEGFHKPLFGKRRHFIDLISIGIVAEDGRSYYAISTEFNPKDADQWVKDNVISKLPEKATSFYDSPRLRQNSLFYKTNEQIAKDIVRFIFPSSGETGMSFPEYQKKYGTESLEIYAYYADYDWVVFCSLFGRMIDLPRGFPMYCRDLKQMLDEKAESLTQVDLTTHIFTQEKGSEGWQIIEGAEISRDIININDYSTGMRLQLLKSNTKFPKQQGNVHDALDDAKWNKQLYDFIKSI